MPWTVDDVEGIKKGLNDQQKRQWVAVANDALARCLEDGGADCDAVAIRQANGVVEESAADGGATLGDKILEAVFDEGATLKATIQGFLKAAQAVTKHQGVPEKVKKEIDALRRTLASRTWADIAAADAEPTPSTATESEAIEAPPEPLTEVGTIVATFKEEGELVAAIATGG